MGDGLKKGWTRVAFGDVVRLCRERSRDPLEDGFDRLVGLEHLDPGELKIRRWGHVADGTTFTSIFRPGQVLFGKRRAYQRKVAVADFSGVCSGDIYVLEPKNKNLLPELLPFICQSERFFEHAIGTSAGSLSPRTNWESLASFQFTLPPLEEQRRISKTMKYTQCLIESFQFLKISIESLEMALAIDTLATNHECKCRLAEVARFRSGDGIIVSQLPKSMTKHKNIPVFGGNGIAGYTDRPMKNVPVPTVVIGRVGEYCGAVHVVREPAWISDNALYMCEMNMSGDMDYIAICLLGARLNRLRSGGAQPLVNQNIVGNILIPLPSLQEQKAVVCRQKAIREVWNVSSHRLAVARILAANILKTMEQTP